MELHNEAVVGDAHRSWNQILISGRYPRRQEHDVEVSGRARQVEHVHSGQRVGVMREWQTLFDIVDPDAGMEVAQDQG